MDWIDRLTRAPGVTFRISAALRVALQQMPVASFRVEVPPLQARQRTWGSVSAAVRKQLAARKLDYDTLAAEARRRRKKWGPPEALRALSSLVEHNPGDSVLARDLGFTASAMGLRAQAYHLFRRVAAVRPYEPQTYRGLADVLAGMGKADLALVYYEVGLAGRWDRRFGEYNRILGLDYLRFLRRMARAPQGLSVPGYARARLKTVSRQVGIRRADLVVAITWNTDGTDVDLHVVEPTGEECYYKHPRTKIGGRLTADVTQGYGPEMYTLKHARSGLYRVRAKYYASNRNRASTRTKVHATIYKRWGTRFERQLRKVVTLDGDKEMQDIISVEFVR